VGETPKILWRRLNFDPNTSSARLAAEE
jgi:hypothetical protein